MLWEFVQRFRLLPALFAFIRFHPSSPSWFHGLHPHHPSLPGADRPPGGGQERRGLATGGGVRLPLDRVRDTQQRRSESERGTSGSDRPTRERGALRGVCFLNSEGTVREERGAEVGVTGSGGSMRKCRNHFER